jgi:glycerol uptake operon antiterminator
MNRRFVEAIEESPIIAAVKDMDGLQRCFESDSKIVFILFGDICNINDIINTVKSRGRIAIVHMDLINGLSQKEISVDYIKNNTQADGIISTKLALIKRAKELKLFTVFRFFVIDSMAFENIKKQSEAVEPDYVEILPGVMPKVIKRICSQTLVPVIAGGLIADKEDVMAALSAGAVSISTTNQAVWFM